MCDRAPGRYLDGTAAALATAALGAKYPAAQDREEARRVLTTYLDALKGGAA